MDGARTAAARGVGPYGAAENDSDRPGKKQVPYWSRGVSTTGRLAARSRLISREAKAPCGGIPDRKGVHLLSPETARFHRCR